MTANTASACWRPHGKRRAVAVHPVQCRWCAVRIELVELLVGEPQWRHRRHRSDSTFVHCRSWPYPPAEPEPWTLQQAGVAAGSETQLDLQEMR
jgi:hypothetical protein